MKTPICKISFFSLAMMIAPVISAQEIVESIHLDGPRVGETYIFPGAIANKLKKDFKANPLITQFGWQFETQYFNLPSGTAGLVEAVALVGGLEQGLFLPSGSLLVGLRSHNGFEFGFGPNLSLTGAAFIFAIGITFHSSDVNFPVNIAFVPSKEGARISFLFGFNARHR